MPTHLMTSAALLALAAIGVPGAQQAATRADFEALVGYFASESATWQQDNADPGDGEAKRWVRRHRVAPDSSSAEVVAIYGEGRCELVTTFETRWLPEDNTISVKGRTASGLETTGTVEVLGGSRYLMTIRVALPDGTELRMRDTTDLSEPDSAATNAERWTGDGWVQLDSVTWRRAPADAWCRPD